LNASVDEPRVERLARLPLRLPAWVAPLFVWGTWSGMLLVVLLCIIRYGRNIPLAEDWHIVPALTGNEVDFWGWLWAQNNEHRVPLPRLLLLSAVWISGGDFRAGMVLNTLALAAAAAAMIFLARRLRGHVAYADAFFPLALLHLGHWENLVWSWQIQFVSSMLLTTLLLLLIVRYGAWPPLGASLAAALGLLLLPLVGANGLAVVPAGALWLAYLGYVRWHEAEPRSKRLACTLWGAASLALLLIPLYFVGYERPSWVPPNPGPWESLVTSGKFLAMSLGPIASAHWTGFTALIFSFFVATSVVLLWGLKRARAAERPRALGLVLFFGVLVLLILAMGWGRAALVPTWGMPDRYALLAVPILIWSYYVWQLYGPPRFARLVQVGLAALLLTLLPFNTLKGFEWRNWYARGMRAVEADIAAGASPALIAERHRVHLLHWDQPKLEAGIRMLREAGIGPFAALPSESPPPGHRAQ
jgi:hypothetical protein